MILASHQPDPPLPRPPPASPVQQIYGEGAFEDVSASKVEMWKSKGRKTFVVFTLGAAAAAAAE